ncbi:MAG: DUF2059 domain-containing protein [Candidatus Acidiferrales bacterium]
MKFQIGILAAAMLIAGSTLAQMTPANGSKQKPATQRSSAPDPSASASADAGSQSPNTEKIDPAKEAAIRHLMDITETSKLGDNIANAITTQVRSVMGRTIQQPDRLQTFMDAFSQKFAASAPSSAVTNAEIPVYAHFFSMEDIQGLIKFYESPLGQRVVKALPQVVQETQRAGVQIDQKAAMDVLRGMVDEYPELKPMLPPTSGTEPGAGRAPGPGSESPATPSPAPAPKP